MATCKDCLKNCDPIITDRCVKYTGPDVPLLGICKGDSLFEFEAAIVAKLTTALDGRGITLEDLTLGCAFLTTLLDGREQTLENVLQVLLDGECNLNTRVTALEGSSSTPFSFNTQCLTGTLSSRDYILQATINKVCDVDTRLSTVENEYIKQSDLCAQVNACIAGKASSDFKDRMVPYAPIPYIGPLSNFDNTGKGLSSTGFDKVYLMNGLNGTQDWRGRSPIGAIQNVPGGTYDAAIDPSLPENASYNYALNQRVGANSVTLSTNQMPLHSHSVLDPGHRHFSISNSGSGSKGASPTLPIAWSSNRDNGNQDYDLCVASGNANAGPTNSSTTGITLGTTGQSQSHTNVQPSAACYYIIYIP